MVDLRVDDSASMKAVMMVAWWVVNLVGLKVALLVGKTAESTAASKADKKDGLMAVKRVGDLVELMAGNLADEKVEQ